MNNIRSQRQVFKNNLNKLGAWKNMTSTSRLNEHIYQKHVEGNDIGRKFSSFEALIRSCLLDMIEWTCQIFFHYKMWHLRNRIRHLDTNTDMCYFPPLVNCSKNETIDLSKVNISDTFHICFRIKKYFNFQLQSLTNHKRAVHTFRVCSFVPCPEPCHVTLWRVLKWVYSQRITGVNSDQARNTVSVGCQSVTVNTTETQTFDSKVGGTAGSSLQPDKRFCVVIIEIAGLMSATMGYRFRCVIAPNWI
jgi:hypothetical protein